MPGKTTYWVSKRPSYSKRQAGMTSGAILEGEAVREAIYRLYRRYAKQWNDIELDTNRSLNEHTEEICDARVAAGSLRRFFFNYTNSRHNQWVLELSFSRKFKVYYPGFSCGLNALRSTDDIRNIVLHWNENGDQAFREWIELEAKKNKDNGEWTEYKV